MFRPGYHHSFHFDESEFSTTLMLQESEIEDSGLFQFTHPLRRTVDDLVLSQTAKVVEFYDAPPKPEISFDEIDSNPNDDPPKLHTLDFRPGTLSIFSGSRSLHRVTPIEGMQSRLVAVMTFAGRPGFSNSAAVQKLFWGRSVAANKDVSY